MKAAANAIAGVLFCALAGAVLLAWMWDSLR